jgi:hypothetical protein
MSTPEPFGLRLLRRSATKGFAVTVYPDEAADVVAEIERLRGDIATFSEDFQRAALRDAEAKGRREMREEAAKLCEAEHALAYRNDTSGVGSTVRLLSAIRSLPDTEVHHADR